MASVKLAIQPKLIVNPTTVPIVRNDGMGVLHKVGAGQVYEAERAWALRWLGERYLLAKPVKPKEIVK